MTKYRIITKLNSFNEIRYCPQVKDYFLWKYIISVNRCELSVYSSMSDKFNTFDSALNHLLLYKTSMSKKAFKAIIYDLGTLDDKA